MREKSKEEKIKELLSQIPDLRKKHGNLELVPLIEFWSLSNKVMRIKSQIERLLQ